MMNLIENHDRRPGRASHSIRGGIQTDLMIGHDAAVVVRAFVPLLVREMGIDAEADAMSGLGPLLFEMVGGAHHDEACRRVACQRVMGDSKRKPGLAWPGRRYREKIPARSSRDGLKGPRLPVA